MDRQRTSSRLDDREVDGGREAHDRQGGGRAYLDDEIDDDDDHVGVSHQRSRAPIREEAEEDVAEEDIMEILDDDR